MRAYDELLGRDLRFDNGRTVMTVTVIGYCPRRGFRIVGKYLRARWISHALWQELYASGVLS